MLLSKHPSPSVQDGPRGRVIRPRVSVVLVEKPCSTGTQLVWACELLLKIDPAKGSDVLPGQMLGVVSRASERNFSIYS